ncbi:MAG: AI-2E family transporter [Patescibacteria group bacterium]
MEQPAVQRVKFDISTSAIIKILVVIFGIFFLQKIQSILLLLLIVLILVTALSPIVDSLVKRLQIKRWLAVTLIFSSIAVLLILVTWLIVPLLFSQTIDLLQLPQIKNLFGITESSSALEELQMLYAKIPGLPTDSTGFVNFFSAIFGGIASAFTILVLSLYLLLDEDGIRKYILTVLPTTHKEQIVSVIHKISVKLGYWLRGQLSLGLIIGLIDLVILLSFGVPYALTLAIFAGVTELIPYLGPFLGYGAALFVALTSDSSFHISKLVVVVGISIGYLVVQQLEGNFLVPKVMQKSVGLSPVIIIVAILIGAKLFGLVGVILSVPIAAGISVIADEWPAIQQAYHNNKAGISKSLE